MFISILIAKKDVSMFFKKLTKFKACGCEWILTVSCHRENHKAGNGHANYSNRTNKENVL